MSQVELCWYAGVVVFRSGSDTPGYRPLYEESIVMVHAASLNDAHDAVKAWVNDTESEFENGDGERISWKLDRIVDVREMPSAPGHKVEVYSRHFRDFESYSRFEPLLSGTVD